MCAPTPTPPAGTCPPVTLLPVSTRSAQAANLSVSYQVVPAFPVAVAVKLRCACVAAYVSSTAAISPRPLCQCLFWWAGSSRAITSRGKGHFPRGNTQTLCHSSLPLCYPPLSDFPRQVPSTLARPVVCTSTPRTVLVLSRELPPLVSSTMA